MAITLDTKRHVATKSLASIERPTDERRHRGPRPPRRATSGVVRACIVVWLALSSVSQLTGCSQQSDPSPRPAPAAARPLPPPQAAGCAEAPVPAEPPMCR